MEQFRVNHEVPLGLKMFWYVLMMFDDPLSCKQHTTHSFVELDIPSMFIGHEKYWINAHINAYTVNANAQI